MGLWLAVMQIPPAAPDLRRNSWSAGSGTIPRITGVHPTLSRPAMAAWVTISRDGRVSVPITIGPPPVGANAAANAVTSCG
jgi:hypothetical protein